MRHRHSRLPGRQVQALGGQVMANAVGPSVSGVRMYDRDEGEDEDHD